MEKNNIAVENILWIEPVAFLGIPFGDFGKHFTEPWLHKAIKIIGRHSLWDECNFAVASRSAGENKSGNIDWRFAVE